MSTNNEIIKLDRSTEVEARNQYMTPRKARIYTQASWDNAMPGMVGLSVFIEAENNGSKYSVGKTRAISDSLLPKIRLNLDKFGAEFTKKSMENTTETSFKSLLSGILDNILTENKEQDEE